MLYNYERKQFFTVHFIKPPNSLRSDINDFSSLKSFKSQRESTFVVISDIHVINSFV